MKTIRSTSTNKNQVAQQKCVWVLTHRSKRSSRIASVGLEHLKVKATSSQVKLADSKSTQESREQPMNQSCFLASFFLNLGGEIPIKGVRFVTPWIWGYGGIKFLFKYPSNSGVTFFFLSFFAPLLTSSQVIGNDTSNIVTNKTLQELLLMYHAGKYVLIDEIIGCAFA
jgi:hypothetical protein